MRKLGWVVVAFLVAFPAAVSADAPCHPVDGTRIAQTNGMSSLVTLTWEGWETPATLQLSASEDFAERLIDRSMPCCEAKLRNLERGRYYWRVLTDGDQELCRSSFEIVARTDP